MVVFAQKETVFFVGGRGTKAGDANAGGCTKAYWGDLKSPNKSLSDVMGTNGEPISAAGAWGGAQNACTVTNNGSGNVRITLASAFADCEAGHIANVDFAATYSDGRYEVTADGYDWIDIDLSYSADTTCDVKVGGAFPGNDDIEFQALLDCIDATNYDVFVLTNTAIESQGYTLDIDTGGGSSANGSWKRIIGVNANGVELPAGSYVEFDVGANDIDCFFIDDVDCIEFRHIFANKSSGASTKSGWLDYGSSTHYGLSFVDCKSTGFREAIEIIVYKRGVVVLGGHYSGTGQIFYLNAVLGMLIKNVIIKSGGTYLIFTSNFSAVRIDGCILDGDGYGTGLRTDSSGHFVVTNTIFYKVTAGIQLNAAGVILTEYNNIYLLENEGDKAINRVTGSIAYSDYSCLWTIEGAPIGSDRWGGGGKTPNAIEENPDFVNAAGGDFRPRNPNVLRGGLPDIDDDSSQMGAILQKYQFARRARGVNVGRLQIIR